MKTKDFLKLVNIFPLPHSDPIFNGKRVLFVADFLDALRRNKLEIVMPSEKK